MISANKDLQATHEIISLIERSKKTAEGILDELPDFFGVIDKKFNLLKGNNTVAQIFQCSVEDLLSQNLKNIFEPQTWNIFESKLNQVLTGEVEQLEFELNIDKALGEQERIYYWNITPLRNTYFPTFSVVGHDITHLRAYEKQLAQIFSSIPLGILTLKKEGIIEGAYSQFTEWLLDTKIEEGQKVTNFLFPKDRVLVSESEKRGIDNLLQFQNIPVHSFDVISKSFPQFIQFQVGDNDLKKMRHLGLRYQPIVLGESIKKLMIIIEDKTQIFESESGEQHKKGQQDYFDLLLHLKSMDDSYLEGMMSHLKLKFQELEKAVKENDINKTLDVLMVIVEECYTGNFERLLESVQNFKNVLLESIPEIDWGQATAYVAEVGVELNEVTKLCGVLKLNHKEDLLELNEFAKTKIENEINFIQSHNVISWASHPYKSRLKLKNQIQDLSRKSMTHLIPMLKSRVESVASSLNKKVHIQFANPQFIIHDSIYVTLNTALLSLIKYIIYHHIEGPDFRKKVNKPEVANLTIRSWQKNQFVYFEVSDDGLEVKNEEPDLKLKNESHGLLKIYSPDIEAIQYLLKSKDAQIFQEKNNSGGMSYLLEFCLESKEEMYPKYNFIEEVRSHFISMSDILNLKIKNHLKDVHHSLFYGDLDFIREAVYLQSLLFTGEGDSSGEISLSHHEDKIVIDIKIDNLESSKLESSSFQFINTQKRMKELGGELLLKNNQMQFQVPGLVSNLKIEISDEDLLFEMGLILSNNEMDRFIKFAQEKGVELNIQNKISHLQMFKEQLKVTQFNNHQDLKSSFTKALYNLVNEKRVGSKV